LRYWSENK